jgi:hypothetical protein
MRENNIRLIESLGLGRFNNAQPEAVYLLENKKIKGGGGSAILLNLLKEVILT